MLITFHTGVGCQASYVNGQNFFDSLSKNRIMVTCTTVKYQKLCLVIGSNRYQLHVMQFNGLHLRERGLPPNARIKSQDKFSDGKT